MAITEEQIFSLIGNIMARQKQNRQLQDLAASNGLDVKNTVKFTDDTNKVVTTSVVALALALQAEDPAYQHLCRAGLEHRSAKVALINKYKAQANQMIDKYTMQLRDSI